jgi:hypothetical protein
MTRLQLHLSAKNLKNLGGLGGFMGKSDPFAVVTVRGDNANNKPVVVGQTDVYVNVVVSWCWSACNVILTSGWFVLFSYLADCFNLPPLLFIHSFIHF